MNSFLAEMYGTGGADESEVKVAQYEAFAKLAADNGVDLSALSADQVSALFEETVKAASDDDDEDDTEEQARAEHAEKKESHAKLAEADFIGRQMAHAFTHELGQLQKEAGFFDGVSRRVRKVTGNDTLKDKLRDAADTVRDTAERVAGDAGKKARRAAGEFLDSAGGKARTVTGVDDIAAGIKALRKHKKGKGAKDLGIGGAKALGTLAVLGGAGYGGVKGVQALRRRGEDKTASALDELAAVEAVKAASAAGYDVDVVVDRLDALISSGAVEETKVAYVSDFGDAVQVRGLELLEAAGVPVNWDAVFGG
jgi:hypothetical protein